jgi:DNA-binding NarL/FixJ family response regulator
MRGESLLSPSTAAELLVELGDPTAAPDHQQLGDHELEVRRRVGLDMTNNEMADELSLPESEVRAELASILARLQLRSRI